MDLRVLDSTGLPTMSREAIDKAHALHRAMEALPQVDIEITHCLHDGVYARTAFVPAGIMVMGVLIKIPTTVIVSGHAKVFIGDDTIVVQGYRVIAGAPGRKQAALALEDTHFTMLFATSASTIEEAEREFTDEVEQLTTRRPNNQLDTGAKPCLEQQ
jgi:hypothetical protein